MHDEQQQTIEQTDQMPHGDQTRGTCRACSAPLRWEHTNNGKPAPLDRDPGPDGNVALVEVEGSEVDLCVAVTLSGGALEKARQLGCELRTSHFATCPERNHFKK